MIRALTITTATAAFFLAGCAQQEDPAAVRPEPVFDKFGVGACTDGYVYVPGAEPERAECIPEDACEPVYDSAGQVIDCRERSRYPEERDSDRDSRSDRPSVSVDRNPTTGGPSAPAR